MQDVVYDAVYQNVDVDGDSFDSMVILPPPPPKVSGYEVKEMHASQDYHQTFLLTKERQAGREYCIHSITLCWSDVGQYSCSSG